MKTLAAYNNSSLLQQTYQFISKNFDKIVRENNFTGISETDLTTLIANIDRHMVQESLLYTAIISWVRHDQNRETEFSSLFLKLNLQNFSPDFMLNTIANEYLVTNNNACLNAAFSYFTFTSKQAQKHDDSSKILCLGGYEKNVVLEVYNCLQKPRKDYPNLPYKIVNHRSLKLRNFVYCVGGVLRE